MKATKSSIITLPNEHLRQRSKKVSVVDNVVRRVINNMKDATIDWEDSRNHEVSVALAAVQIDKLLRIVIVRSNPDNKQDQSFGVFINPEITKYEGTIEKDFEGCLSIKDIYGKVPRYSKVRVKALDINGKPFRVTADGFLARIFQHEIDHTNGKVFIDHIKNSPNAFYRLLENGELEPLDYKKDIVGNKALW